MTSTLGLPRYVITFLRHMETHKDYLKWNISESTHKITLTLTWNFRRNRGSLSDNFLEKLQRTLNIGRSPEGEGAPTANHSSSTIPKDLSKVLENTPKKHKRTALKQRLSLTVGAIRRTLSTGSSHIPPERRHSESMVRRSSSLTMQHNSTAHSNFQHHHSNNILNSSSLGKIHRNNSFHYTSAFSPHNTMTPVKVLPSSPARSTRSWGGSLYHQSSEDQLDASQDLLQLDAATGSSCCSEPPPITSPPRQHIKLTYRSEEEIEESLENIMEKTRIDTQAKLELIKKEWDETIQHWPRIIMSESGVYRNPPPSLSSTFIGVSSSVEETEIMGSVEPQHPLVSTPKTVPGKSESPDSVSKLQDVTVGKCLDSCDKILTRYETDIT